MSGGDRYDVCPARMLRSFVPLDTNTPTPAELYERRQRLARNRAQAYRARLMKR